MKVQIMLEAYGCMSTCEITTKESEFQKINDCENMMLEVSRKKPGKNPDITEAKLMTSEGNKNEFSKRNYAKFRNEKISKILTKKHCFDKSSRRGEI